MKNLRKLVLSFICISVLAACSSGSKTEKKELIIGLDNTFAPMGFKDKDDQLVGFDVELATEVGKIIDKTFAFQNIDWDLKESELSSSNIDLIWNGYTITEKRKEKVLFTEPYLDNRQLIITLAENDINSKDDLSDKTVSVQKNSSAYEAVMKESDLVEKLSGSALVLFDTNNDCFMDLETKRSDAIVVDETLARYYMRQQKNPDLYKVLSEDFGEEEYAIGLRKSDKELCESINKAIETLKENGKFDAIKSKWFK